MYSPLVVFCYNRPECLSRTIANLQANTLAKETDLFIFSDSWKAEHDKPLVEKVRAFIRSVAGFKSVTVYEAPQNQGLAASIISGVSSVLERFPSVIVLEDDLLTSATFLEYMNESLNTFAMDKKVFSISGYTIPMKMPSNYTYDNYFTQRASSWGWATWRDRWKDVDWQVSDYDEFIKNSRSRSGFNAMGSDLCQMLDKQMAGKINSWAIRWTYHQYKTQTYTSFPVVSKVQNIGFGEDASNTVSAQRRRFYTPLDTSRSQNFSLNTEVSLHPVFRHQFVRQFSITTRIYYKILTLISGCSRRFFPFSFTAKP